LRFNRPQDKRPFKIPFSFKNFAIIPAVGVLVSFFMIFFLPLKIIGSGIVLIGLGFLLFKFLKIPQKKILKKIKPLVKKTLSKKKR